jgi:hypothetical protein
VRIRRWMRALLVVVSLSQFLPTFALATESLTMGRYGMTTAAECVDTLTGRPHPIGGGVVRTRARPSVARLSIRYARSVGGAPQPQPMTSALLQQN